MVAFAVAGAAAPVARAQGANDALSFTPGEIVQVASSPSLNSVANAITLEAWVRVDDPSAGQQTVLRRNLTGLVTGAEVWMMRMESFNGFTGEMHPRVWLNIDGNSFSLQATVPLSLQAWHHWAATFDGTFLRIYWDGTLAGLAVHPGTIASTTAPLFLGGGTGTPGDSWRGQLDEVRIWNVARTQAEIQASMFAALAGTEPGLLSYWRFEEGIGQFAGDSTGNGNVGILGVLPVPDFADPDWVAMPFLDVVAVTPDGAAAYESTAVTITGSGFSAAPVTVTVGGIAATGVTVLGPGTLQAVFPPGPAGFADVAVSNGIDTATLTGAWEWFDRLHTETTTIPLAVGGTSILELLAGPAHAGKAFVVLSSVSGTSPGVPVPGTPFTLPLNPDAWTDLALGTINSSMFAGFLGILDPQGEKIAVFDTGPGPLPSVAVGVAASFAYVVVDLSGPAVTLVSNPVTVTIVP